MATKQNSSAFTLEAASDLSSAQYRFVKVDTSGKAALAGVGERAAGVLVNDPTQGQAAAIEFSGVSKVTAGASVTAGDALEADTNGKAVTQTTGVVLGVAIDSGAADEIISVLLV